MAKVPRNKGSYSVYKDGRAQIKFPLGFNEKTGKYGVYNETSHQRQRLSRQSRRSTTSYTTAAPPPWCPPIG